jgi:flagellar biosynthetic protein FliR
MQIQYEALLTQWSQLLWPIARLTGLMLTMPIFSTAMVPSRIKIIFVLVLAFVSAPLMPEELTLAHFQGIYLVYLLQELLRGLVMGFILQIVFQAFVLAGQIIAMQSGLGFAVMVDPASRASVPLVSQFYLLLISLVFLSLNGHLALLDALLESFKILPPGKGSMSTSTLWQVTIFSGWMFKEALLIVMPAVFSLLIVSMSFGVMARVAPQLNIFALGFPVTLLMGIILMKISLPNVVSQIADSLEQGLHVMTGTIQ